jgi:hypothetical protein
MTTERPTGWTQNRRWAAFGTALFVVIVGLAMGSGLLRWLDEGAGFQKQLATDWAQLVKQDPDIKAMIADTQSAEFEAPGDDTELTTLTQNLKAPFPLNRSGRLTVRFFVFRSVAQPQGDDDDGQITVQAEFIRPDDDAVATAVHTAANQVGAPALVGEISRTYPSQPRR